MSKTFCPNCYAEYENQPESCSCGYPFNGTEMEKYNFMTQKGKKESKIKESVTSTNQARKYLFVIGGINLLFTIINMLSDESNTANIIPLFYSIILIGLGFYSYKEPFLSLLLGIIVLIFVFIIGGFVDSSKLFKEFFVLKIGYFLTLIYALYQLKIAEKIKKEL
jgi:hypothetical protein